MESDSHRDKSKYQRQRHRAHRRRRNRQLGRQAMFGAAIIFAIIAAGAAGVWTVVHFGKSQPEEQAGAGAVAPPPEPPEPRLIGIWFADADATIAQLATTRLLSKDEELDLRRRFYKTIVTFSADTMTTNTKGHLDTLPYEVVSKDDESVVLKVHVISRDDKAKADAKATERELRLRFAGKNTYWMELKPLPTECFRRIQ